MTLKSLLFAALISFASLSVQAQPNLQPLPDSLIVGKELLDTANGFAINIDQPRFSWFVASDTEEGTQYVGIDEETHSVYLVGVDKHHFSEFTPGSIKKFVTGVNAGMTESGWKVTASRLKRSTIPRQFSYRFDQTLARSGGKAKSMGFATSPEKLYAIQYIAHDLDEKAFEAFAASFRLLP